MATNDKVIVKVQKGEEIRRFQLDEQISWKDFQALVTSLFPSPVPAVLPPNAVVPAAPRNFVVKYKDAEGDVISVTSDSELQEAIRLAKLATLSESPEKTKKDSTERILKFFIVSPDEPDVSNGGNPCGWAKCKRGQRKCCHIAKFVIIGALLGLFLLSKCHLLCFGILAAVTAIGVCCYKKAKRFHCNPSVENRQKCCVFTCFKKFFGCQAMKNCRRAVTRCGHGETTPPCKIFGDNNNNNNACASTSTGDASSSTEASAIDDPKVGVEDIVEKLKQLEEMGFHDSKKNLSVLSAHNFNVVLTVKDLLDKHN